MYTPTVTQNKRGKDVVGLPQDLWNALDITGTFGGITRPSGQLFTQQYDDLLNYANQMAGSGQMSPELMAKYGIGGGYGQRQGLSQMQGPMTPQISLETGPATTQGLSGLMGSAYTPQTFSSMFSGGPGGGANMYGGNPYGGNPYQYNAYQPGQARYQYGGY